MHIPVGRDDMLSICSLGKTELHSFSELLYPFHPPDYKL